MERKDKIITQEEFATVQAEITRLEMEQNLTNKDNSLKIKELKNKIGVDAN